MAFLSRDSRVGVSKSCQQGLPRLWSPITLRTDLKSRCGLKQSCSFHRELSKGMLHALCKQVNRVDSRLFLVRNQTANLTPGLLLAITCASDVWMSNTSPFQTSKFQELSNDIKNSTSHWVLTPKIALWSFGSPPRLHLPKWELPWECECSFPHTSSHFLTFPGVCDVTHGLPLGPHPYGLFALALGLPFDSQPCNPFAWSRAKAKVPTQHGFSWEWSH
jgi:hypothetical protein